MSDNKNIVRKCECPIDAVAQMLGRKWVIIILRDMFMGKTQFKDFLAANPSLSNKVLSQKLKDMESDGLIKKEVVVEPLEVNYRLTNQGKKLKRVLREMVQYGKSYCDSPKNYAMLIQNFQN